MQYLSNRDQFWCNLVQRCILGLPTWWLTECLKNLNSKMANGCSHLENRKIAISQKPFGRFWNFAWWHILVLQSYADCSKNQMFKNPWWQTAAILKMLNAIFQQPFGRYWRYLYGDAHWSFQPIWWPQIWKFENPTLQTATILKIEKREAKISLNWAIELSKV